MWNITKNDVQAMVTRGFRLEYIWERSNVKETEETEEGRRQTVIGDNEAGAQRPSNLNYSYRWVVKIAGLYGLIKLLYLDLHQLVCEDYLRFNLDRVKGNPACLRFDSSFGIGLTWPPKGTSP